MTSLLGKPLGTGNYNFYTCQYQLWNIDFPVISTLNRRGKRIVIPGCDYKCISYEVPVTSDITRLTQGYIGKEKRHTENGQVLFLNIY